MGLSEPMGSPWTMVSPEHMASAGLPLAPPSSAGPTSDGLLRNPPSSAELHRAKLRRAPPGFAQLRRAPPSCAQLRRGPTGFAGFGRVSPSITMLLRAWPRLAPLIFVDFHNLGPAPSGSAKLRRPRRALCWAPPRAPSGAFVELHMAPPNSAELRRAPPGSAGGLLPSSSSFAEFRRTSTGLRRAPPSSAEPHRALPGPAGLRRASANARRPPQGCAELRQAPPWGRLSP